MVPWLLLEYLGQVACSLLSFTFCFPCWLLHTHCWHLTVLAPFCWWHHQWLPVLVTLCYKSPTIIVSSYHISSNHSLSFTHNVRNENHLEGNVCLLQQFFFSESSTIMFEKSHDTNAASVETGKILTTNRKGSKQMPPHWICCCGVLLISKVIRQMGYSLHKCHWDGCSGGWCCSCWHIVLVSSPMSSLLTCTFQIHDTSRCTPSGSHWSELELSIDGHPL